MPSLETRRLSRCGVPPSLHLRPEGLHVSCALSLSVSLLDLDALSPREAQFVGMAESLADVLARSAPTADREGRLAEEAVAALRASLYPSLTVPAEFGGQGATLHEFVLAQERLGRADTSLALVAAMNAHVLGSAGEARSWPAGLYARVAGAARSGALTNALASEPELGSPSRGGLPRTRATRVPGGWRVNGAKTWSTGATALDFLVVSAAEETTVHRLVIEADRTGVSVERTWGDGLALRGSDSHDVIFEDVFVPQENLIPPMAPAGPESSAWFWSAITATYLGAGVGALQSVTAYARERVPTALGRPIATLPTVQENVGRIELDLAAAQALLHRVTRAWVEQPARRASLVPAFAGAKSLATNAAVRATDLALRVAGAPALDRALPIERFFRDARAGLTHPPTDETALGLLGRARLGQD